MATLQDTKEQLLLNKLLRSDNYLDYTGLTYSDILTKVNEKLAADPEFDNFRESAIAQTMIEIFAGAVDLCNHYIERRAEECYFDTARLKSSVILLARQLSYDVQRRIPAEARIKVRLKGDLAGTGALAGEKIQIPQYTPFTGEGNPYILKTMFEYTITSADIASGAVLNKEITENELTASTTEDRITLTQGEIKSAKIPGNTSNQVSQIFQTYRITDKEFSNMYGDQDYDDGVVTKVGIGTTQQEAFSEGNTYEIDRRSLLKVETLQNFNFQDPTAQKICLIRTATDEGIDLKFGDGKYAAKGLDNSSQTIYVQYLATIGTKANKAGVIGNKLQAGKAIKTVNGKDVSDIVQFEYYSNIVGGSDLESIESIKSNAPSIFYSLDRVVTKKDYQDYLKTLSSPIVIRNAVAWGEQEEVYNQNIESVDNDDTGDSVLAIKKLFNVVLFSCMGSLYNIGTDIVEFSPVEDTRETTLDVEDADELIPAQNYMNVFVAQNIVQQVKYQKSSTEGEALTSQRVVGSIVMYPNFTDFVTHTAGNQVRWAVTLSEIDSEDTYTVNMSAVGQSLAAINQTSYVEVANRIQDVLRDEATFSDVVDFEPFTYVAVTYVNDRFEIKLIDNKYKIEKIWDGLDGTYSQSTSSTYYNIFGLGEGLYTDTYSFAGKAFHYSDKVDQVVRQLNQRSQLTVKNIYVSPTIHPFNINGTIYCRPLVDKDTLHTNIKNKIYTWADQKADFNNPIYLSNIIELIESFPNVVRADIKLAPRVETLPTGQDTWFPFADVENYMSDFYSNWSEADHSTIQSILLLKLTSFLNAYTKDNPTSQQSPYTKAVNELDAAVWARPEYQNVATGSRGSGYSILYADRLWYNVQIMGEGIASNITERSFYYELIYNMYKQFASNNIVNADGWKFEESPDFYELVNLIHKDLAWIIRYNMIDSHGNIAPEKAANVINNQEVETNVGGGYTLGNEIVQLWMNTQTQYVR